MDVTKKVQECLEASKKYNEGFFISKTVPKDWDKYVKCDICERSIKENNLKSLVYEPSDGAYSTGVCLNCLKELVRLLEE